MVMIVEIPRYVTSARVGREAGVSRNAILRMAAAGKIHPAAFLETGTGSDQPVFLLSQAAEILRHALPARRPRPQV